MERSKFNYLATIIRDYPRTDTYIKNREKELMNRFNDLKDENVGGGRAQYKKNSGVEDMAIDLAEDLRLHVLRQHADAVKWCLDDSDMETQNIINELYLKEHIELNIWGVSQKVHMSVASCKNRRQVFFEKLASKLGI